MYPAERHKWLVTTARDEGRVSVTQASERLGVVPETIRRDLDVLTSRGLLTRVHGGAIPAGFDLLGDQPLDCLLYTSPSPRDQRGSRMPSSA